MKEKVFSNLSQDKKGELMKNLDEKLIEIEQRLAVLARIVGGDFGMSAKFGEYGSGSYFDPDAGSIVFDPKIIENEQEWLAEFVAGHEGGHRAITRSLEQIGVKHEKALELYEKLGFGYLLNCIEDCADNDWVSNLFEKFRKSSDRNYQESFSRDNAIMSTPEIDQIIGQLGYVPKFVNYGSEIIRKWATGGYSQQLEEQVDLMLKKTEQGFESAWQVIPEKYSKEKERVEKARERFQIIFEKVLPEFEKLVEQDIDQEKLRQLADELLKNQKQDKLESGKEEKKGSERGAGDLPEALKKELDRKRQENMKEQVEEILKQLDELNKSLNKDGVSGSFDSDDSSPLELPRGQRHDLREDLMKQQEGMENGQTNVVPWDDLSDELKEKLKEIFDKLPQNVKDDLEKKAKQTLEKLDDELIKEGRSKLSEDESSLTHKEVEDAKQVLEDEKEKRAKRQEEDKQREDHKKVVDQALSAQIETELGEYERIYQEVAPLVDELTKRIQQIFLPQRYPRWEKGYDSGHRLDLGKVMQFEADKSQFDKLWERKTIPKKIDYRFSLLVDLSGSMREDGRIEQTFRGVIVLAEVLNRIGIKTEIIGFQDDIIVYKTFDKKLDGEIRERLTMMIREVEDEGEHNQSGWNSDGYCLQKASQRLQKNKGKDNFLIPFSDGEPVPDSAHDGFEYDLGTIIEEIGKKTNQKLIGVGLGEGTEHVADYYPISLPNLDLKKMPELLGALLEDMIKYPNKYK